MLKSPDYKSRDASNDLLHQLSLIDTNKYMDTVKGEIGGKLGYLKSCDDYCTQEACDAITVVRKFCSSLCPDGPKQKMCGGLVDFMLERELGQLIVKMLISLTSITDKSTYKSRLEVTLVIGILGYDIEKQTAQRAKVELVKCGVIPAILKDLDLCDPNTDDPRQRIRITLSLFRLYNLVDTKKVIPIYRSAKAVDILMKFARAEDVMTKIDSFQVLACIINEEESKLLAATTGCIVTILEMLQKAAESNEKEFTFVITPDDTEQSEEAEAFYATLLNLTRGTGNLATNDANKEAIVQHGGVPVLTTILRPEYKEEERQAAAEALWKLSFLESNVNVILTYLTYTDEEALAGRNKSS